MTAPVVRAGSHPGIIPAALLVLAVLAVALQGCAPAIVAGGAATGAMIAHDRRTTGTVVEDRAIILKVAGRISDDEELDNQSHINVNSYNGVVVLTGETPSAALRARAEKHARQVEKVRKVYNELVVAAPSSLLTRTSDTLLLGKIKGTMLATEGVDPTRTKVIVEQGRVYLMGLVTDAEAHAATEVVRRVDGVQKVIRLFEYIDPARQEG
ncbi:MAG: BON domain-containing protein [Gammaproteobacteria bacterium]|nr:BON domain-containing protein [Gammaproteobacteria bacterium]